MLCQNFVSFYKARETEEPGSALLPLLQTLGVIFHEHEMITIIFFPPPGRKYFPSTCSRSWAHFPHIIQGVTFLADVDAAFNQMSFVAGALAPRVCVCIHAYSTQKGSRRRGADAIRWESANQGETDKWATWLPVTALWSFQNDSGKKLSRWTDGECDFF